MAKIDGNEILEYRPSIKDTWNPTNEIGNTLDDSFIEQFLSKESSTPTINKDEELEEKKKEIQEMVLEQTTSDYTVAQIASAVDSVAKLYNYTSQYSDSFPYSVAALEHAYNFWNSVKDFILENTFTKEDLKQLKEAQAKVATLNADMGNITDTLSTNATATAEIEYENIKKELMTAETNLDSISTKCYMGSDVNISVSKFALDCQYICDNLYGAIDTENEVIEKQAADLFLNMSKDDVSSMGDMISKGVYRELNSLKRVQEASISDYDVSNHFYEMAANMEQKTGFIPKAKHIFRNTNDYSDFTNSMIYDIYKECRIIDKHFMNHLDNTIRYMHAENTITLKTFTNEIKLNRFNKSADTF